MNELRWPAARTTAWVAAAVVSTLSLVVLPVSPAGAAPGSVPGTVPAPGPATAGGATDTVPVPGSPSPLLPVCAGPAAPPPPAGRAGPAVPAAETEPPAYYAVELVPTRRVPGTRQSTGVARATFQRSPFGVSVAPDGSYSYSLSVQVEDVRARDDAEYVVWVTRSDLSEIRRVGVLDGGGRIEGGVAWNKFLVVVTLEAADAPVDADTWQGPIVLRGMSRSGRMHTMAGHGPFQAEPCVKYGYR